jgi:sugar phosphate isomerase/epimerase
MQLGLSVWTLQIKPPFENTVKRIADLGFKGVELVAWNIEDFDVYYTQQHRRRIREQLDSLGLNLTEFVSTPKWKGKSDDKPALEHFQKLAETASDLGTKIVASSSPWPYMSHQPWPDPRGRLLSQTFALYIPSSTDWQSLWQSYCDFVARCTDIAQAAGLKYAIEAHPFNIISNSDSVLRLTDYVKSKSIGINYDFCHFYVLGDIPPMSLVKLKGKILHIHVADTDGLINFHWRPGKGRIDWVESIRALKETGYDGALSLELTEIPGGINYETGEPATETGIREIETARDFIRLVSAQVGVDL